VFLNYGLPSYCKILPLVSWRKSGPSVDLPCWHMPPFLVAFSLPVVRIPPLQNDCGMKSCAWGWASVLASCGACALHTRSPPRLFLFADFGRRAAAPHSRNGADTTGRSADLLPDAVLFSRGDCCRRAWLRGAAVRCTTRACRTLCAPPPAPHRATALRFCLYLRMVLPALRRHATTYAHSPRSVPTVHWLPLVTLRRTFPSIFSTLPGPSCYLAGIPADWACCLLLSSASTCNPSLYSCFYCVLILQEEGGIPPAE